MFPYVEFIEPQEIGYTDEMKRELLLVAHGVDSRYKQYVSLDGYVNQLEYFGLVKHTGIGADDFAITQVMRKLVRPEHTIHAAIYIRFGPNKIIAPHVDDHLERTTCLTFPLSPEPPDFAPTVYVDDGKKIVIPWDGRPGALNTRIDHAVYNNDHTRYSFQLCFSLTLEEFMSFHNKGELFHAPRT